MAPPKGHPGYPGAGRPKGKRNKETYARLAGEAKALKRLEITAERTMLEAARVAFVDRTAVFKDGRLLPVEEWPAHNKALLEGFEVIKKNAEGGDGHQDTVHKVHLAKKFPAIEALMKHFGLIGEKAEDQGHLNVAITVQLQQGRLKNAAWKAALEANRSPAELPEEGTHG